MMLSTVKLPVHEEMCSKRPCYTHGWWLVGGYIVYDTIKVGVIPTVTATYHGTVWWGQGTIWGQHQKGNGSVYMYFLFFNCLVWIMVGSDFQLLVTCCTHSSILCNEPLKAGNLSPLLVSVPVTHWFMPVQLEEVCATDMSTLYF